MMCLYPRLIKNKKYISNKKNGGIIPPIQDDRIKWVPVGCTNCIECRKQKAREWQARLTEDIKENKNGKFITLTFSNESINRIIQSINNDHQKSKTAIPEGYELDNQIATWATRHFLERWRKKYKKSIRHWLVTELGHKGTENIHLHGIIWTDYHINEIETIWQYGWIWKGKRTWQKIGNGYKEIIQNYVNEATVNYVTKYVTKSDQLHPTYKSKILTSDGIGANYITNGDYKNNKYKPKDTNEAYKTRQGYKLTLPIYWRNKIYTEEQREELWLQKLDKEQRWILGQKISIANGEQNYIAALKEAQQKNKRLALSYCSCCQFFVSSP